MDKLNRKKLKQAPQFLKTKPIWVLWKLEPGKSGKLTKVPYQVEGKKASSMNPKTWSSFDEVVLEYNTTDDKYDGIAFVFDGTFTGIDVDHCVADGNINDVCTDIIKTLDSYTELSPSKTGVHIIVDGVVPQERKRESEHGVEMYGTSVKGKKLPGRFFTFTGSKLTGGPDDVVKNIPGLQAVYDKYLRPPLSAMASKRQALMNGDLSEYKDDHSAADMALCNILAKQTGNNAERMDAIFRTSGLMRDKWDELHGAQTYGQMTIEKAIAGHEEEARKSEGGNACRLDILHGHEIKYCGGMNTWFIWNGNTWIPDEVGTIYQMARDVVEQLFEEAEKIMGLAKEGKVDGKYAAALMKFAYAADSSKGITSMVKLISTFPHLSVKSSDFDDQQDMLNMKGATIDFTDNSISQREPNKDDLITKVGGCAVDLNATCPQWLGFLNQIFDGNVELIRYVQKAVGYSLTGRISEKCFFFCYGDGSNGKTVFLNVLQAMFGGYGQTAAIRTFLKRRSESDIRDDLVNLKGARFVASVEPDDNARFDMEVMKPLTGNDFIRCRTLHQRQIQFRPEVKLWIAGNNKPQITETTAGAWDRVKLIPFEVSFVGREDRNLEAKLREELSGILNWALEGYKLFKMEGLGTVDCISQATNAYKLECNSLLTFIETHGAKSPNARIKTNMFYIEYKEYCQAEGLYPYSSRRCAKILKDAGVGKIHLMDGDYYTGVDFVGGMSVTQ